jgi:hypothetical protein
LTEQHAVVESPANSPLDKVEAVFRQWLLLKDPYVVRAVLAAVVANRMSGDPLWMFLVAPPSGVKTELLVSVSWSDFSFPLSDLTSQTFASGMRGEDPSLLSKLKFGQVLILKDFTTVLSMDRDRRAEILSQLREIYDGAYKKSWGTGKILDWHGKLGLIAGVTPIIDTHYSVFQTLGERFVQYRVVQPDAIKVAKIAIQNQGRESEMRAALAAATAKFFSCLDMKEVPELDDLTVGRLAALAAFCVRARSGVVRDAFGGKEVEYVPEPEAPGRLAKQLALFYRALLICQSDRDVAYYLAQKIAFDSIHKTRFDLIRLFHRLPADLGLTTSEVAEKSGYPTRTIRRYLEDLTALDVIAVSKPGQGKPDRWRLSTYSIEMLQSAELTGFLARVYHVVS